MSKVFAVRITEVIERQCTVFVRSDDKANALDAGTAFARSHDLKARMVPSGYEMNAYTADVVEVAVPGDMVDVEA